MTNILFRRRGLGKRSCEAIAGFSKTGIIPILNNEDDFPEDLKLVIRWGCTGNLPIHNVLNQARAIHLVANKSGFRKLLSEEANRIVPATSFDGDGLNEIDYEFPKEWVIRPQNHAQGKNLWVVDNWEDFQTTIKEAGQGWYASELINKTKEYRVCFVQGRVAWVANKIPADENVVAWNVAQGGRFENVRWSNWPLNVLDVSQQAFELSGLDFGGVDIMVNANNISYILEINSAPSLTSPYRQECMAKCFDYIIENGKEHIDCNKGRDWRGYIHPSLYKEIL